MEQKQRRNKGEGSIFQRDNGRFVVRYKGKETTATSKREAVDKLNALKAASRTEETKVKKILMNDAISEWMNVKSLTLKPTSYDRLEQTVNTHIRPAVGNIPCNSFSEDMLIREIIDPMRRKSLSFSSIKKAQDAVCAFCRWASSPSRKYMSVDPVASFERITRAAIGDFKMSDDSSGVVFLDRNQREAFIAACRATCSTTKQPKFKYGEALIFDMYTGLRMGELLALRWEDIDFQNKTVRVAAEALMVLDRNPQSPSFGKKILVRTPYTKTNRPRLVPLSARALEAANALFERKDENSIYVVANKKGDLVRPCVLSSMAERIYDLASITKRAGTNVHALRHTFASMCFATGMPVRTVSELLGHGSVQITMDTYIHLIHENNVLRVPQLENIV